MSTHSPDAEDATRIAAAPPLTGIKDVILANTSGGPGSVRQVVDPVSDRGKRTRSMLLDAARQVFEEWGYGDASVALITEAADVSHGTFYTYFESKLAIFAEVVKLMIGDFRMEEDSTPLRGVLLADRIERAIRAYLTAYSRNARMMAVQEEAAIASPEMQRLRVATRREIMNGTERAIRRWQAAGLADSGLDPRYTANALGAMIARFAYVWLVQNESFELECSVETLTVLYCRALGLHPTAVEGPHKDPRTRRPAEVPGLETGPAAGSANP